MIFEDNEVVAGQCRHAFRRPLVAQDGGGEQPGRDQVGRVALTLSDNDGGAGAGQDDVRPVEQYPPLAGPENPCAVAGVMARQEAFTRAFFGWNNAFTQFVADLLADQRRVGEPVVEL